MDIHELETLLRSGESDRVERKRNAKEPDDIRKAICAFANDLPNHRQPGVIFVGVEDDGSAADLQVSDKLLTQLADMRADGKILPFPRITVQEHTLTGKRVVVIEVPPSTAPPLRHDGRCYVRVGPTTREATPEEERRLAEKRRAWDLPFDLQPVPSASLEDLNLAHFREEYLPASIAADVLEQNRRTVEDQLCSLRFTTPDDPPCPTVLGLLVAGKEPRRFIPGAYIQFLRIDGRELGDPIKVQSELDGPLLELLQMLDQTLQVNISVGADFTSAEREIRRPDYPLPALQQITRNAVLHRSYDRSNAPVRITWFNDRIEIQNPGGPFGQVTRDNFGQAGITDYRNPNLAEAMKHLGYVQRFGVGIATARRELADNGNPPPDFDVQPDHVLTTVRSQL